MSALRFHWPTSRRWGGSHCRRLGGFGFMCRRSRRARGNRALAKDRMRSPLLQPYVDVVVEGGLEDGPDFAREILETTDGWNNYWLNDRQLARRPRVHDPSAAGVDAIIAKASTAASLMKGRLFPEDYTARLLMAPAK